MMLKFKRKKVSVQNLAIIAVFALMLLLPAAAAAEPTTITVKVLSKGAKFIGTSMGGVQIIIRNMATGEILAQGVTQGGTGNTAAIMKGPRDPGRPLSDASTAFFAATIDISSPVHVQVSATGPLSQIQARNTATVTQWVVPGRHIRSGDAWLLELPGLAVDITVPASAAKLKNEVREVPVQANVTMMCGCPLTPDGLWDSNRFEVAALVYKDGQKIAETPLAYAGAPSQFQGRVTTVGPGIYELFVYAYDAGNGNTGLDRVTFAVK